MKIAITTDSSCDLTKNQIQSNDIHILPFKVMLGDREYTDGLDIHSDQIFDYVDKNNILPKTSAINVVEYEDFFKKILKKYDAIIHISLSFEISSTGRNAILASESIGENKVFVIDSKSLSSGVGLVVLSASDKVKEGKTPETIVKELDEVISKVQASFVINRLNYLHKGGRCSTIQLLGANMLKIKPKIALVEGKMGMVKKYMGKYTDVIAKYVKETLNEFTPDLNRAFCTYSSKMPISDDIEQQLKNLGFKEVVQCYASSTISSHCGPETIGILYITK